MAKRFKIGVMTDSFRTPFAEALDKAVEVGAEGIQLYVTGGEMLYSSFTPEKIAITNRQLKERNLVVSAVCGDFGGHGFESEEENKQKIPASKQVADLAKALGSGVVTTHIGVVPEDKSGNYEIMKAACKEIGDYAANIGVTFAIETGPEKPETLRDFIIDVGSEGIGVNLDPANLVMVTDADPVQAVYTLKDFIVHTHAKDGVILQKTEPKRIYTFFAEGGIEDMRMEDYFREVPLGEGSVDFDAYLKALDDIGFDGFLTIERECGANPFADIKKAADFLNSRTTIKKIGFIDYFLDEWHALNYPKFIKEAVGREFEVAYAYGETDSPNGGMTTDQWCEKFGVRKCETIDEVVEKSDVIIVLSPDHPERHWDLCQKPLRSGKRVYVDKTFSLSKDTAQKLVDLAESNNTPFFSSSALRFSEELKDCGKEDICFVSSRGPGSFDTYAIHQIEPIVILMGSKVSRLMAIGAGKFESLVIEFEGGRRAVMSHYGWTGIDFSMTVSYTDGKTAVIPRMSNYFPNFIKAMCDFFKTGEIKAKHDETVAIMGIIEAGNKAILTPGIWVNV
ncbi:MAG: TIM barrel protein [Eubacteriales bacterium]|nr:TIM barrel protein [Eubacteriales bacterium]